jgi:peptide/nickel transport system substrate-binding protein
MAMATGNEARRFSRRRALAGGATGVVSLAGMAALGACASPSAPAANNAPPASAPTSGPAAGAPAATPTAAAKYGGTFSFAVGSSDQPHLDPHQTNSFQYHVRGAGVAYSQLLRYKSGPGVQFPIFAPEPDLAQSYEQPDDLTYTFKLRQGVKFQNKSPVNGRELVADDVVKSYQRQVAEKINAGLFEGMDKVEAVDKYTVRVKMARPNADFIWGVTSTSSKIIPPEILEGRPDLKEGPVIGSGPFIFDKWDKGSLVSLVRNPDYYEKGLPYVDRLQLFRIPDPATLLSSIRGKQLDVGSVGLSSADIDGLVKANPQMQVIKQPGFFRFEVQLRSDRPPFDDLRVRQAISKAIDRTEIVNTVLGGGADIGTGLNVPSADWLLPDAEVKKLLTYDPDGARALLKQAGKENLTVECVVGDYLSGLVVSAGELLKAQLAKVGVTLNLKKLDGTNYALQVYTRAEYEQMAFAGQSAAPQAPTNSDLQARVHSKGPINIAHRANPEIDKLIEQQAVMARDVEGRKKVILDIQRKMIEDAAFIAVCQQRGDWVVWPHVKNFYPNNAGGSITDALTVWLDK